MVAWEEAVEVVTLHSVAEEPGIFFAGTDVCALDAIAVVRHAAGAITEEDSGAKGGGRLGGLKGESRRGRGRGRSGFEPGWGKVVVGECPVLESRANGVFVYWQCRQGGWVCVTCRGSA